MNKLNKIKLKESRERSNSEMKDIIGGYDISRGTCSVFIPQTNGTSPSLGNYDSQATTYSSGGMYINSEVGYTIHKDISYESAMGMISGISGAKWCCDNCNNTS